MKTVSAYQARTNFGEILNLVYYQGGEVVVERKGKPMVKIVKFADKKPQFNLLLDSAKFWKHLGADKMTKKSAISRVFGSLRSPFGYVPLAKVRLATGKQLGKKYQPK